MKTITVQEFKKAVEGDPAWASKLTEPIRIPSSCNMESGAISHLSPLLHFDMGTWWNNCKGLKVLEGHFADFADFENSAIEEIGEFHGQKNKAGLCCDLGGTPLSKRDPILALKTMTGSSDPEVWKDVLAKTITLRWNSTWKSLSKTINVALRKKMADSLKKESPLEI
jgi:hypothetical protein